MNGITGQEVFSIDGMADKYAKGHPAGGEVTVRAERPDGSVLEFPVRVRIDTPEEANYYLHGGILTYVLRRLAKA
ncbi:MAG: hypothetical protein H6830_08195 [Planctomycetes bacterium]|nr:hypothetical protein [Planctomycetota bacterium]HPF13790.1 hypothetical protein [Planctomycetota bacterium]HRV81469.1 hypothetical protein [Planctomycetota bacterium]